MVKMKNDLEITIRKIKDARQESIMAKMVQSDLDMMIHKIKDARQESIRAESMRFDELENVISSIVNTHKTDSYNSGKRFIHLENRIQEIKRDYIESWQEQNIAKVKEIVEKIDPAKGIILPILAICGHGTQEIRFTKYLAYFLDPSKNHGLGAKLLEKILSDFDTCYC